MNLETAGAETPAADGVEPEALVDNTSDATTEGQSEVDPSEASADTGDNSGDDAAAQPEKKNGTSKRIDELTRLRREAERRAERAEKALEQARTKDISELDYDDQIAEKTLQRTRQDQAENDRETARELKLETYHARAEAAQANYPDFESVAHKGWEPTPVMLEAILDSECGPEVAYHLGKNPAERNRIASLSPISQVRELGKLEVRLTAPKQAPKPPAEPVRPVSGIAAGGPVDPSKMSMSEYVAARNAGKI